MSDKRKLVVLTGPTAVGKTELSISLAQTISGEIISADSVQVYRDMNIGSAKITAKEMNGVRHHLIDILCPEEPFNVAEFKRHAASAIEDITSRGNIPIIVGGTGFYIQAVLKDVDFTENQDDGYRSTLEQLAREKGAGYLHDMLKQEDMASAEAIHENNVKRVIRALEYKHQTGRPISEHNQTEAEKGSPYNFAYFVLNCNRELLYQRIDKRVDMMLDEGLLDEVKMLCQKYDIRSELVSMQALGYKEMYSYLMGEISLDEAVYRIKRDTRHFAKRQLTWFKREQDVIFLDKDKIKNQDEQLGFMLDELRKRGII